MENKIVVLSHQLNEVEVDSFFWVDDYGWCFDWYEDQHQIDIDCKTYGKFPSDFLEVNTTQETNICNLLDKVNKKGEITIDELLEYDL